MLKQPESRGYSVFNPETTLFPSASRNLRFHHRARSGPPVLTSREPRRFITLTYFSTLPIPFPLSLQLCLRSALFSPTIAILCSPRGRSFLLALLPSYYHATFDPVSFPSYNPALFISPPSPSYYSRR